MKSEIRRFRNLALAFAGGHLLILGALMTSGELFSAREDAILLGGMAYSLSGLLFGLYQIGSYRRRHLWIYLLHRPLAPGKIFRAIAGAGAVLFTAVFVLPWLLVTLISDLTNWQWVDGRHYLLVAFILGMIMVFYLIGCFIMLSPCPVAFLLLVMPVFFITRDAAGLWVFVPLAVVLAWTGYLAYSAFKPDLSAYPRRPLPVALIALPIQYVAFWGLYVVFALVYSTTVAFTEQGWKSFALHSWDEYFAEGTFIRAEYMSSEDVLVHGLSLGSPEASHRMSARIRRAQIEGVDVIDVLPRRGRRSMKPQTRGQLMFMDRGGVWYDPSSSVRWVFSHDTLRFHGLNWLTGSFVGWLGSAGGVVSRVDLVPPFSQGPQEGGIPSFDGEGQAYTRKRIYDFDFKRQRFDLRFEVMGDEFLVSRWVDHEDFGVVLSDRAVYLFEPEGKRPVATLPWQGDVRNLSRVLVARPDDGFLLSLIFGRLSEREIHEARQTTVWLGEGGAVEVLADEPLAQGPPAWTRHSGFIASPVIQNLHDGVWSAIEPYSDRHVGLENVLKLPTSPSIWGAALLLASLSGLLTAWLARKRSLDPSLRWAWILAGFFVGLPALVSFLFLTPTPQNNNLEP